jgi:hypothetical protein
MQANTCLGGRVSPHGKAIPMRQFDDGLAICRGGDSAPPRRARKIRNTMKHNPLILTLIAMASLGLVACNKQKAAIDDQKQATLNAIDDRKVNVNAEAKEASAQADINAVIDKANIEADRTTDQARLDAAKKQAEADAIAAKARVDAENR